MPPSTWKPCSTERAESAPSNKVDFQDLRYHGIVVRLLIRVVLLLPGVVVLLSAVLVMLAVERTPMVPAGAEISFAEVKRAHQLLARYDPRRMTPNRVTTVRARERDLDAALRGAVAAIGQLSGRVLITRYGVLVAVTAELPVPPNPFGRYVNLRLTVAPSQQGLEISRLAVGSIEIPPAIIGPALRLAFDYLVGAGKGKAMLESIRSVRIVGRTVLVRYRPPARLVEDLTALARQAVAAGDAQKVRVYYRKLVQLRRGRATKDRPSLTAYIGPLFRLARDRSRNRDPVEENRAAVLALAMYFGDSRFERLIGDVRTGGLKNHRPRIRGVRLGGRHDLVRHFTVSAGLALTGGAALADLIGEAKEIDDSGGASGFSFADLAANRAGVRFAEAAVAAPSSARRFQAILSGPLKERDMFPTALDLPEGLSEAAFRRRFRDINHPVYNRLMQTIERRIDAVALYR